MQYFSVPCLLILFAGDIFFSLPAPLLYKVLNLVTRRVRYAKP